MPEFEVSAVPLQKLARNRRFAVEVAALVWPELLSTGSVIAADAKQDIGELYLSEFDKGYRKHVEAWLDENVDQLEAVLSSLAQELAWLLAEVGGTEGRPHDGG